jgi:hypothetical protein
MADRVGAHIVILGHLRPELPGAQVADQRAAQPEPGAQDGIDHGAEHRFERRARSPASACRGGDPSTLTRDTDARQRCRRSASSWLLRHRGG